MQMNWKHYQLNQQAIGSGYNGEVYLGYDTIWHIRVAIKKQINIELAKHEAYVMRNYGYHPYLPMPYDFFVLNDEAFLIMDFCSGTPLGVDNFNVPSERSWTEKEAIMITINILKGLKHLHNKGFFHDDLLPKNILVENNKPESVRIIDFGDAYIINKENWQEGYYKDVYEVGLIFVYLLKGFVPEEIEMNPEIKNKKLQEIIYKAISPDLTDRYEYIDQFIGGLEALI